MNGRVGLLVALLVVQVLVIGTLWLIQRGGEPAAQKLLDFAPEQITRIEIDERGESGDASVSLQRQAAGWTVDDHPVDGEKLTQLLDKLSSLDGPWPVATTAAARDRFEVTEETYQKRVRLLADEAAVATLLLGTSPGFKRIHARRLGDDEVYSVALTSLDLPTRAEDWLDKSLLAADSGGVGI